MSASCAAGWGAYLSLLLPNGFHEKASLVKVNVVVSEAEIKATKRTPLAMLPFALSLSLLFGGSLGARWVSSGVKALQSKVRPLLTRAIWRSHLYTPALGRSLDVFVAALFTSALMPPAGLSFLLLPRERRAPQAARPFGCRRAL